jgi:hypothetical protein
VVEAGKPDAGWEQDQYQASSFSCKALHFLFLLLSPEPLHVYFMKYFTASKIIPSSSEFYVG